MGHSDTTHGKRTYLVKLKSNTDLEAFSAKQNVKKGLKRKHVRTKTIALELSELELASLQKDNEIAYIEADAPVRMASIDKRPNQNSTLVKKMGKTEQTIPEGLKIIGADLTFRKYSGKNVKVAVIDSGIGPHEDINIKGGVSFVDYTSSYFDDNGHGTHVAGTIAACDNKLGVVGVAPGVELYAVKVLDQYGGGSYSGIIAALEWAIDNKMDIINLSLGGTEYLQTLQESIQQAIDAGITIVAAAGNMGPGSDTILYPAKFPSVVAVGAIDENLELAPFSSTGPELNIMAPGTMVLSTNIDGQYATMSGTSMAAPHVTGALAALKGKNKKDSSAVLKEMLYETATPFGSPTNYGHGLLNLAYAAGEVQGPIVTVTPEEETELPEPDEQIVPDAKPDLSINNNCILTACPIIRCLTGLLMN